MEKIINGKEIANNIQNEILQFVNNQKANNKSIPTLAIVQIGNDGGSTYYRNSVVKQCLKLGIITKEYVKEETTSEEEAILLIKDINEDKNIHGALVLMPFPKHINSKKVINILSPEKDIDGLTDINSGKLFIGEPMFVPCTPSSVIRIIESIDIELSGKEVVVIGRSNVVGKPLSMLLLNKNATVTIAHSKTKDLKEVCRRADVLVSAIGVPNFVTKDFVKKGAVVIDVGTSNVEGKITGDVNLDNVLEEVSMATPVPGGVGAVTTSMLLKNLCKACEENVY
ncbi:MAG: bifunctional 5,10-methylenetetrahydrofolate dehydrogenase/5,10-methenyltetrahydrofolate cyclohydrolase [Clostridiaceae bacterium]